MEAWGQASIKYDSGLMHSAAGEARGHGEARGQASERTFCGLESHGDQWHQSIFLQFG